MVLISEVLSVIELISPFSDGIAIPPKALFMKLLATIPPYTFLQIQNEIYRTDLSPNSL